MRPPSPMKMQHCSHVFYLPHEREGPREQEMLEGRGVGLIAKHSTYVCYLSFIDIPLCKPNRGHRDTFSREIAFLSKSSTALKVSR